MPLPKTNGLLTIIIGLIIAVISFALGYKAGKNKQDKKMSM